MRRHLAMEYDDNSQFIPNDADIEFEKEHIIASTLHPTRNGLMLRGKCLQNQ